MGWHWYIASKPTPTFTQLLLQTDVCYTDVSAESIIDEAEIDFDCETKVSLKKIVIECENTEVPLADDEYFVSVNLKDPSTYANALRKFAYQERLQIRKITNDLLEHGIIKVNVSPYCARIVPMKKRNGDLRLCVDLRPFNARIVKQKYPFSLIEDYLIRLGDKSIFTLLDLRDGFQIKIPIQRNIFPSLRLTGNLSICDYLLDTRKHQRSFPKTHRTNFTRVHPNW